MGNDQHFINMEAKTYMKLELEKGSVKIENSNSFKNFTQTANTEFERQQDLYFYKCEIRQKMKHS